MSLTTWERLAEAAWQQGETSRCPSWCYGEHLAAIEEGCAPHTALEHLGAEQSHQTPERRNPHNGDVLHQGGDRWRTWAEKVQVPPRIGLWLAQPRLYVEVGNRGKQGITIELTVGEVREFARALERLADTVQFE